jgi:WD40-like Beta Propeller Repeat
MLNISKLILRFTCMLCFSYPAISQEATKYKIGVGYGSSLYSNMEKFEFVLNGGEKIMLSSTNPIVYFSQQLNPGQTYSVTQVSGPRSCNMWSANEGTIANADVLVSANCGNPPLSIFKLNVIGIQQGESFSFADNYRRTYTYPFSTVRNLGGFPQGDYYLIKQTGGPRPCKLTSNEGTVPENTITIQADCRKPPAPPVPPKNTYDLVTRSSDDKIVNTYYETFNPVVGGKSEDEGRYVAFGAYGKGIDGSSGNFRQIFLRDRKTGVTKLISKTSTGEEANGNCQMAAISADGKTVAFESYATNLVSNDNNGVRDVFAWNISSGITLISIAEDGSTANGESYEPTISGDGNVIAFTSGASNIVKLQPVYSTPNVYVYRGGASITFISKDFETGKAASGYSPSISDDGNKIAFCAYSNRLANGDNNNLWDIFLWENGIQGLKRLSLTATGGERNQGTESSSRVVAPAISGDGNFIAYATTATNMVPGDNNGMQDIFLYNTSSGALKRISTTESKTEGDGDSPIGQGEKIGINYNGSWITYNTAATNLGVPKGNIVLQNTESGKIIPITKITNGSTARPMLSKFGNYVVAGCSEPYDKRFSSSGIFAIYTNIGACNTCND